MLLLKLIYSSAICVIINKHSLTTKKFKLSGNAYTIRKWMQINMRDGQYLFLFMMSLNIPDLHLN
jgi:hypothetical protein